MITLRKYMPVFLVLLKKHLYLKPNLCYFIGDEKFNVESMNCLKRKESILRELEKSIEKGELSLVYQPQVYSKEKKIVGVEALARWTHETYGSVPPNEFIKVAEENGFIGKLGYYILEEAIKAAKKWLNKGYNFGRVAVNVSALELLNPRYLDNILALCKKYDLPHSYIEIEITESVSLDCVKNSVNTLRKLIQSGIRVTLDDFGRGYSNFNSIIALDFFLLKIDKSLIDTLHCQKTQILIRNFMELSNELGCQVIAEGVEIQEQVETLDELGCYYIQGYHYSKPVPDHHIDKMLALHC